MALSATPAKVTLVPAKAGQPGFLILTLTFAGSYVNGALDLSAIAGGLHGVQPADIRSISGNLDGYHIEFVRAASPAWTNLGVVKAWNGTTEASGTFAKAFTCIAHLSR